MNIDLQGLASIALDIKAKELRKSQPHLTEEQAFSKVYQDPENIELQRAERAGSYAKLYPPIANTTPIVGETDGYAELKQMAADFRKQNPTLTAEQAFAKIYSDPSNRELVRRERNDAMSRLGMTTASGMAPI